MEHPVRIGHGDNVLLALLVNNYTSLIYSKSEVWFTQRESKPVTTFSKPCSIIIAFHGACLVQWLSSYEIELVTQIPMIDEIVCVSLRVNVSGKGMDPFALHLVMGK